MNFFKNHLVSIIISLVGLALFALSSMSKFFTAVSMICFSVASVLEFIKSRQKMNKLKEENSEENVYFDATKYDYDEDVYYIGEEDKRPKIRSKFSKFTAMPSAAIWIFMAVCFAIMAVYSVIKF